LSPSSPSPPLSPIVPLISHSRQALSYNHNEEKTPETPTWGRVAIDLVRKQQGTRTSRLFRPNF
jgi:hypothetical protein